MMSLVKLNIILFVTSLSIYNGFSQNESINSKWNLAVNGIELTENTSLTVRENRFSNFELSLIEVPILLKVDINDKLSGLLGLKLDFYRNSFGFSKDIGISATTGFQYDFSPNTYMQVLLNYKINSTNSIYHYNFDSKFSFMLNAGFKF